MLMSMTGFGRSVVEISGKRISVEIKSLNSKQMDLNTRIPSIFRAREIELRNYVSGVLQRGKADLCVNIENTGTGFDTSAHLNTGAIRAYRDEIAKCARELGVDEPRDWFSILLRMPDSLKNDNVADATDEETEALTLATHSAVNALMEHRRAEGLKLEAFFTQRIEAIAGLLSEVEPFEGERIEKIRCRLAENLAKVPVAEYDKGRLEQEMIFYIEKLDVNEEKQRLAQHLRYFMETMNAPESGQGKKLGFIAQEMGREINTLGSKSNHAEMQKIVVLMKDNLEQIKEQVLNVM